MRRSLVQRDERARHPFLQQLPPHVRQGPGFNPIAKRNRTPWRDAAARLRSGFGRSLRHGWRDWRIGTGDVKDFLLAYGACFVAISAFIA